MSKGCGTHSSASDFIRNCFGDCDNDRNASRDPVKQFGPVVTLKLSSHKETIFGLFRTNYERKTPPTCLTSRHKSGEDQTQPDHQCTNSTKEQTTQGRLASKTNASTDLTLLLSQGEMKLPWKQMSATVGVVYQEHRSGCL